MNRLHPVVATWAMLLVMALAPSARAQLGFDEIVVMGDSLSDNGNLFAANGGLLPPPPYFDGRATNGLVWNEVLAADLGVGLDNLAVSGASTGSSNVWDTDPDIGALGPYGGLFQQVGTYLAGGVNANALHMVWAGSNNFLTIPADPVAELTQAIGELAFALGVLEAAGVDRVLVLNLPDFGLTPRLSGTPDEFGGTLLSVLFNQALDAMADGLIPLPLGLELPDMEVFDLFSLFDEVVADPAAFGFTNVTDPCFDPIAATVCANPDEYLFWDDIHPTAATHSVLAGRIATALQVPAPSPLVLFLAGLIAMGLRARRSPH